MSRRRAVLTELAKLAFAQHGRLHAGRAGRRSRLDFSKLTADQAASAGRGDGRGIISTAAARMPAGPQGQVQLASQASSRSSSSQASRLFKDRVEHTGKDGVLLKV